MTTNEIKKILGKFDKVLEDYELDKEFGQMSVDSICHLFPSEMIIIKDYITNLQEENERLKELYIKTCKHLFNIGNDELARYFQAQINECNVFVPQNLRGDSNSTKYKSERC